MKTNYFGIASAIFSIAAVIAVVPVWTAGTHRYGAISGIWQTIDLNLFMAVGFAFVVASVIFLWRSWKVGGFSSIVIPLPIFAFGALQFGFLSILYVLKVVFLID